MVCVLDLIYVVVANMSLDRGCPAEDAVTGGGSSSSVKKSASSRLETMPTGCIMTVVVALMIAIF